MQLQPFDRAKHVYRNEAFVELGKDAVRFFSGTPVHPLPPPERFLGTGVYALFGNHVIREVGDTIRLCLIGMLCMTVGHGRLVARESPKIRL